MKEAQVMKVRAKITLELDSEIEKIPKTRKKKECRSGYSLGKTTKYLRINKKYQRKLKPFMNNSMGKKTMSKSGKKSIIGLWWLVGMTNVN